MKIGDWVEWDKEASVGPNKEELPVLCKGYVIRRTGICDDGLCLGVDVEVVVSHVGVPEAAQTGNYSLEKIASMNDVYRGGIVSLCTSSLRPVPNT